MNEILQRITEKKAKLDSLRPLAPALEKNLYEWFRGALVYHSNALEGNTLTFSETAQIIEKQLAVGGGKTLVEHFEVLGHAQAIDYINTSIWKFRNKINEKKLYHTTLENIVFIHRILLQKINDEWAGKLRQASVRIPGSNVSRPNYIKVPELMDEFVNSIHNSHDHIAKIAADAHLKLVFIHPFVDGNGRTARLLMNLILLQDNYPLVFLRVEDRQAYINAIEKALQNDDLSSGALAQEDYYAVIYKAIEFSLDEYLTAAQESKKI